MSRPRKPRKPGQDYEVGYGRPPVATRFQPGQSGNRKGRPKGIKSVAVALSEALSATITVQVSGRPRKMTMQEAILKGLVHAAVRQQLPAIRAVFELQQRLIPQMEDAPSEADALTQADDEIVWAMLLRNGVTSASSDPCAADDDSSRDTPSAGAGADPDEGKN